MRTRVEPGERMDVISIAVSVLEGYPVNLARIRVVSTSPGLAEPGEVIRVTIPQVVPNGSSVSMSTIQFPL
jgi:hypothetical protein